jgi:hypothetical protein
MRHIIIASGMLIAALIITFGTASILQGRAVASGPSSNEPFAAIESAKPAQARAMAPKGRATSHFREHGARSTSARVGL